jgi:hypothetical protein
MTQSPGRWSARIVVGIAIGSGLAVAVSCGKREPELQPREIACPAPAGSASANLFAAPNRLYLTWVATFDAPQPPALDFAVLEAGKWSEPRTVFADDRIVANWADFPSLLELDDGTRVAHWLLQSAPEGEAYDVVTARSAGGAAWSDQATPHRDATHTEHGFVSLVPLAASRFGVAWLDGRGFANKEEGDPSAQTCLMWTASTATGFATETILDERVCDCCQTAAVATSRGVLVAYRDRSADEVRDIALVRRDASGWSKPYALAADGWKIAGCPVNGPALDAVGDRVVAAWFTMHADRAVVRVAFSSDGGATFGAPVNVDDGQAIGRVDVALLPNGDALVVWMETTNRGEASIRARHVGERHMDASFQVAASSAERASGFPRVARFEKTLYFAWTETSSPPRVHVASLDLPRSWQ